VNSGPQHAPTTPHRQGGMVTPAHRILHNDPCPHCARIGGIAAATQDALTEVRAAVKDVRTAVKELRQGLTEIRAIAAHLDTRPQARRTGPDDPRLSRQETAVLHHIAAGHTNPEIADILGVTVDTVRSQAQAAYQRLGARGRTHAVAIAYERGLIPAGSANTDGAA
jgi:DNA-binding NarL/FixJ family response regulator